MACCLLHNFIRKEMVVDPLEYHVDEFLRKKQTQEGQNVSVYIDNIEMFTEWNNWRDALAQNIFNEWSYTMDVTSSMGCHDTIREKSSRGRRSWTKIDALVHYLKEIVKIGWKTKNGFKCGFHRELEKEMQKMFIGTDISANPHIN
ncbi:hypothetical protein ACS0TY_017350 [Phlomoides rotata]